MGVFTSKSFPFELKGWDIEKFENIDPTDGFGISTRVYISEQPIVQIEPDHSETTSNAWLSDKGLKFVFKKTKNIMEINLWSHIKPLASFDWPFCDEAIRAATKKSSLSYLVQNKLTKETYIGSTGSGTRIDPYAQNRYAGLQRFKNHFKETETKTFKTNKNLRKAMKLYGVENFSFHVLELTPGSPRKSEQKFLDLIKPTYNKLRIAGSSKGFRHSTATRKKLSAQYKYSSKRFDIGKFNRGVPATISRKQKTSETLKNFYKNSINRYWHRRRSTESTGKPITVTNTKTGELMGEYPSVAAFHREQLQGKISYKHLGNCARDSKNIPSLGIHVRFTGTVYLKPKPPKFPRRVGLYRGDSKEPFKIYKSAKIMADEYKNQITYDKLRTKARLEEFIVELGFTVKFLPSDEEE